MVSTQAQYGHYMATTWPYTASNGLVTNKQNLKLHDLPAHVIYGTIGSPHGQYKVMYQIVSSILAGK